MAGKVKQDLDQDVVEETKDAAVEDQATESKPKSGTKELRIRNEARRNQEVFGITRRPVRFDDKGIAVVEPADYDHFGRVPGYTKL